MGLLMLRLRRWVLMGVAVPAAVAIVRQVRSRLEQRHGSTSVTRALRTVEQFTERRRSAPRTGRSGAA
jgi:hypothetical protein